MMCVDSCMRHAARFLRWFLANGLRFKVGFSLVSLGVAGCWVHLLSFPGGFNVGNTPTAMLLFGVTFLILVHAAFILPGLSRANLVVSLIVGTLFAFAFVIGWRIEASGVVGDINAMGSTALTQFSTWVLIFGVALLCIAMLCQLYWCLLKWGGAVKECWAERSRLFSPPVLALVIFLCWVPVLLFMFPGINGYDTAYQIKWFLDGEISSHHPVLHTLFIGSCVQAGMQVGSPAWGILFYCIIQMVVMALIFGLAVYCIRKMTNSAFWTGGSLLWFAFCPLNSVFAVSVTKDVLFSGFVILSICLYYLIHSECKHKVLYSVFLIVSVTLALLFRNNAVIAYAPIVVALLVRAIVKRTKRAWTSLTAALIPLVLYAAVSGPAYSIMGVRNSTALAESLSVPLQQLARVATSCDDLSTEEQNFIDNLIPSWSEYQAGISDVVKASLNQEYLKSDPVRALLMWFKIGIDHPLTYIESFLVGTYGYWYPCTSALDLGGFAFHPYFETPSTMLWLDPDVYVTVEHHSLVPAAGRAYEDAVVDHVWEKVPVLSTLMNSGAVIWPTIVLIGYQIICFSEKKIFNLAQFLSQLFLLSYWFSCILGPCLLVRYLYPLFACLPLTLAWTYSCHSASNGIGESSYTSKGVE